MSKKTINLKGRVIGDGQPVFMIAEVGINHNGDINIAKKLIDAAFATNWDCVKFQKRTPDLCVPQEQKNAVRETPWGRMTYLQYREKVEFSAKNYSYLDKYCKEKPIMWTASVWDVPSIDFLLKFNVPFIKIPSAKLADKEIIVRAAKSNKPVMLSTGMSTVREVDKAVELLERYAKGNYLLMHTNSSYPTAHTETNLLAINFLKKRYKCVVGYSGHEYDLEPTVIAVALGAKVIERHVTLSHDMWGSDHFASLEVHAMDLLRKRTKSIDSILGDGVKKITPAEAEVRKKLRGY